MLNFSNVVKEKTRVTIKKTDGLVENVIDDKNLYGRLEIKGKTVSSNVEDGRICLINGSFQKEVFLL